MLHFEKKRKEENQLMNGVLLAYWQLKMLQFLIFYLKNRIIMKHMLIT